MRHRLLDEVCVIKVIRSQANAGGKGGEAADRFLREAKAAIKLRHPNVAVLHDFAVTDDGQAFIVMEHIDGWNLLEVLSGYGPPPVALSLEIARQSLKAPVPIRGAAAVKPSRSRIAWIAAGMVLFLTPVFCQGRIDLLASWHRLEASP